MKIGLISDTHGFLDPRVLEHFADVDYILHGGDIGYHSLILELEAVAPVTAVLGNTDGGIPFRETEVLELGGKKFLLHHIVDPNDPESLIQRRITRERPDVVVFGHTHKPFAGTIGLTLYLNPGYAGKQRFDLKRTIAILNLTAGGCQHQFIDL